MFQNFGVLPNEQVYASTDFDPYSQEAIFYIYDSTSGHSDTINVPNTPSNFFDGMFAQYITERPLQGQQTTLSPFVDQSWSNMQLSQDAHGSPNGQTFQNLGDVSYDVLEMRQGAAPRNLLAAPVGDALQSSTSATERWYACGAVGP